MPTYLYGNLWDEIGKADLILVTTNAVVLQHRTPQSNLCELVMGKGVALQAREQFPDLPHLLGRAIARQKKHLQLYGVIIPEPTRSGVLVGAFQTKINWRKPSTANIIGYSVMCLIAKASRYERIAMPFPGINNGQMSPEEVEPLLSDLPDNVYVYRTLQERR